MTQILLAQSSANERKLELDSLKTIESLKNVRMARNLRGGRNAVVCRLQAMSQGAAAFLCLTYYPCQVFPRKLGGSRPGKLVR